MKTLNVNLKVLSVYTTPTSFTQNYSFCMCKCVSVLFSICSAWNEQTTIIVSNIIYWFVTKKFRNQKAAEAKFYVHSANSGGHWKICWRFHYKIWFENDDTIKEKK